MQHDINTIIEDLQAAIRANILADVTRVLVPEVSPAPAVKRSVRSSKHKLTAKAALRKLGGKARVGDIAEAMGLSTADARGEMHALMEAGAVKRRGKRRATVYVLV